MALRNGSRLPVSMRDVFPDGCHLVPDSIVEAQDYDEATGRRSPAVDKEAAEMLGIGRATLYDLMRSGRVRSVKDGGMRFITLDALRAYVRQLEDQAEKVT
jgi:excisionase family DNA binding protein